MTSNSPKKGELYRAPVLPKYEYACISSVNTAIIEYITFMTLTDYMIYTVTFDYTKANLAELCWCTHTEWKRATAQNFFIPTDIETELALQNPQ